MPTQPDRCTVTGHRFACPFCGFQFKREFVAVGFLNDARRERDEAAEQRDRLLEVIARQGLPTWPRVRAERIYDVANTIAKETGYAA